MIIVRVDRSTIRQGPDGWIYEYKEIGENDKDEELKYEKVVTYDWLEKPCNEKHCLGKFVQMSLWCDWKDEPLHCSSCFKAQERHSYRIEVG